MKIAFVHPALMDYRLELFEELNKRYDITFIFTSQGRGQEGVKESHLKIPHEWDYRIVRCDKLTIRGRHTVTYLKLMIELLRGRYDIIITSTKWYICFPIARITGRKFILWTENWCWTSSSFIERLLDLSTIFIAKHADAIIATGTQSYRSHLSIGVSKEKMFTYPQCAVDYSNVSNDRDLKKELQLENKRVILCLSRITPMKGLDYLIKAFALLEKKMDDVALLAVGDGYFKSECEDLVKKLGIQNALFMGRVDDTITKVAYYKACDVFVLPTIFLNGEYERWGLVLNEAMAFSKPVVTTDAVGAVKDMVHDGYNGYVVKNKNVQELCGAMYKILSNPELAKMMGGNSRKIFDKENVYKGMVAKFIDVIEYVKKGG